MLLHIIIRIKSTHKKFKNGLNVLDSEFPITNFKT